MKHKGKVQIGSSILDAELEIDEELEIPPEIKAAIERMRVAFNLPWWNIGITDDKIVEGSLVKPITDESRLLES